MKLQESNAKLQSSQTWNASKDIFRKVGSMAWHCVWGRISHEHAAAALISVSLRGTCYCSCSLSLSHCHSREGGGGGGGGEGREGLRIGKEGIRDACCGISMHSQPTSQLRTSSAPDLDRNCWPYVRTQSGHQPLVGSFYDILVHSPPGS